MKIDLHLHSSLSTKNNDIVKWRGDFQFFEILRNHKVRIAALSDHNLFDFNYYKKMSELAKKAEILFLPATEINVRTKRGAIGNIIYVFSNLTSDLKLQELEKLIKSRILKEGISLKEANTIFSGFDYLVIPHVGKNDYLAYDDLLEINYDAFEITSKDHHNFKSILKHGLSASIVSFSDTHNWDKYPQYSKNFFTFIKLKNPSFNDLKKAFQANLDYIKTY